MPEISGQRRVDKRNGNIPHERESGLVTISCFERTRRNNMTPERAMELAAEKAANMPIPAPPSPEKVLKTDRDIVGKIVGHLHVAATTLLEGRIPTAEKIKHEIKKILHKIDRKISEDAAMSGIGMPMSFVGPDRGVGELALPRAKSVQSWKEAVDGLIPGVQRLPVGTGSLPPDFKKFLASLIKDGIDLAGGMSSVSEEARKEVRKAGELYARLSGAYFM
jgi:hypothetical protein